MCGPAMLGLSTGFYFLKKFNGASKRVVRPKHLKKMTRRLHQQATHRLRNLESGHYGCWKIGVLCYFYPKPHFQSIFFPKYLRTTL